MLMTKRKLASVGEILVQEFMEPMGLTQGVLADAMGMQRKHPCRCPRVANFSNPDCPR
jgi:antitoxin HigA-1